MDSSGVAIFGDGIEEALNAFIPDYHAVVEESYHEDLLEVTFLHRQHNHQTNQETHDPPGHTHHQQLQLTTIVL